MKAVWHDKEVLAAIKATEDIAVAEACEFLSKAVKDSMVEGNYRPWPSKRGDGSIHYSSKPGTPPAPDTEELKDSISWAASNGQKGGAEGSDPGIESPIYGSNVNKSEGRVGTTNDKGIFHEMAWTVDGEKRPFLRPGAINNAKEIIKILKSKKI